MPPDLPDPNFRPLTSHKSVKKAMERSEREPVVIFKHSTRCGTSSLARKRLMELDESGDPPVYELVIQSNRELSSELAETLGIQHQSPQVIVIYRRKAIFHTSHSLITSQAVRDAQTKALSK